MSTWPETPGHENSNNYNYRVELCNECQLTTRKMVLSTLTTQR